MEEVLAVGDSNFQRKCINEFEKYRKNGKTVILVTHDIQTVIEYCDSAMLLDNGRIISVGAPQKVSMEYQEINMISDNEKLKENNANLNFATRDNVYGNNKASLYDCKIFDNKGIETLVLESGKDFQIKLLAKFNESSSDISFNVTFRDNSGKNRLVFHSLYSRNSIKIKEIKKGKNVEVIFKGDMLLTPGGYNLYIDVCENVQYPKYDVLFAKENILSVDVFSNNILCEPINYNHSTEVKILN
jgi:ABC-type glutathione transport system ATPase component